MKGLRKSITISAAEAEALTAVEDMDETDQVSWSNELPNPRPTCQSHNNDVTSTHQPINAKHTEKHMHKCD